MLSRSVSATRSGADGAKAEDRVPRASFADRAARIGVPISLVAVVIAVFFGERMRVEHELHLVVPSAAAPGDVLPVRALVFDRLDEPDGPRLRSSAVALRIVDAKGAVRAHAELAPSIAGGAEGAIEVPHDLEEGRVWIEAVAHSDATPVASARAPLDVTAQPAPTPRLDRAAGALQRLELGPAEGTAPIDVRVASGACVPEETCELLVHIADPALSVRIEASPSVTPARPWPSARGSLVRVPLVAHGPEARLAILVMRGAEQVGRRTLQLPIALATPALMPGPRVVAPGEPLKLEVRALGQPAGVIADVYREGRWRRTTSFPLRRPTALFGLDPGLVRIQLRTDPFGSERAAVRTIVVRDRDESAEAAVERALAELGSAPSGPPELRLAWAAAPHEQSVHALPRSFTGREADVARVEARRRTLRIAGLAALALGLVVAAVLFVRRGIAAALEAQRIMDATGDPVLSSASYRRRTLTSALLIVLTALLAFVGAAALIIARAHLLE